MGNGIGLYDRFDIFCLKWMKFIYVNVINPVVKYRLVLYSLIEYILFFIGIFSIFNIATGDILYSCIVGLPISILLCNYFLFGDCILRNGFICLWRK